MYVLTFPLLHIQKTFEKLRIERTKQFLIGLQVLVGSMVRPPPPPKVLLTSGDHVNVGEWVEVEHSYVSGVCSDEGVGVVMAFDDKGADVRCVEEPIYCSFTYQRPLTLPRTSFL